MCKQNENTLDRGIRIAAGLLLLGLSYILSGTIQIAVLIFGIITLGTGLTGFCTLYKIFDI